MTEAETKDAKRRTKPDEQTRERLKSAAQELFSKHGIDGVSVRDIVRAAGAKNGASLHYYFGTKEGLITELVRDRAKHSEAGRQAALDALEARGGPRNVVDIVRLLIEVETGRHAHSEAQGGLGHMRFIVALQTNHRNLMRSVLDGQQNTSYLLCLEKLRALMPQTLSEETINQRLIYMNMLLTTALAARETAFETDPQGGKLWSSPDALENLIHCITTMLEGA